MAERFEHYAGDGKGRRRVLVDGKEVPHCKAADTRRGVAETYVYPFRIDKHRKRALTYRLRGVVTVEAMDG